MQEKYIGTKEKEADIKMIADRDITEIEIIIDRENEKSFCS